MINKSGFDCVFESIQQHLTLHSINSPVIKTTPTGDIYPLVVVDDADNPNVARTTDGIDSISLVGIEINIYAKEKTVGTKKMSGRSIAIELRGLIDEVCTDMYGMKRIMCKPTPNIDNAIYRITMRYNAKQNDNRSFFY